MVSTPIADPNGAFVPYDARVTDSRRSDCFGAHAQSSSPNDRMEATVVQQEFSTPLRNILERIVVRTCAAVDADTCVLLRSYPTTGNLRAIITAGRAPDTAIAPVAMHQLPGAEPVRIELADSKIAGWLSSIPGFGALLVGRQKAADCDPSVIELAARLAEAAIDQDRTGTLKPASWQVIDSILGPSASPVVARDSTGRLFHINEPARMLLGISARTARRQLSEKAFIRALDLRDQLGLRINPSMLPGVRLHGGKPAPDLVVSARCDNMNRRWLLLHSEAIRDGRDRITMVFTTLRDFSTMQRYGESQWLRTRVSSHLRRRPIDLASIEQDIAAYLGGHCAIHLAAEPGGQVDRRTPRGPRVTTWRESDEGAGELRVAHGHLHHSETGTLLGRHLMTASLATHTINIPMDGIGETHAHLVCSREAHQDAFLQEEVELLAELADQIGLALTVSGLRESLHAGERQIIDIGQRLYNAEESERRRMALSIHDGLAQVAASVCQQLEIIAHRFEPSCDAEGRELQRARDLARRTVQEARQLIAGLRPVSLEAYGLSGALREEIEALRCDGRMVSYVDGLSGARFDPDLELDIYRVVQEALNNARKYAGQAQIEVTLEGHDTTIRFEVRDDGFGFDPAAIPPAPDAGTHVGLDGMRERIARHGGTLCIDSVPGHGTSVTGVVSV